MTTVPQDPFYILSIDGGGPEAGPWGSTTADSGRGTSVA